MTPELAARCFERYTQIGLLVWVCNLILTEEYRRSVFIGIFWPIFLPLLLIRGFFQTFREVFWGRCDE